MRFLAPAAMVLLLVVSLGCRGKQEDSPTAVPAAPPQVGSAKTPPAQSSTAIPATEAASDSKPSATGQQTHVAVQGTKVRLVKPTGFQVASKFPGFQQDETGSSIMVTEVPGPYAKTTAGFTADGLKSRGMNLVFRQDIQIDGRPGLLLEVTQEAGGMVFRKWITAFGDDSETVLVTATLPREADEKLAKLLRETVLSAKWAKGKAVETLTDLNFAVEPTPVLKFTRRMGNNLVYTLGGVIPAKSPDEPLFIVAPAVSNVTISDRKQYAQQRAYKTANTKELAIDTTEEVTIGGLNGFEIVARARHAKTDTPLVVYQVMLFDGQSYFLMQGLAGGEDRAKYLDEFKNMARTFRKK